MTELLPIFLIDYSESDFTNPHEVVRSATPENRKGNFSHMGAEFWGFESARHKTTALNKESDGFCYDNDAHEWINIGLKARSEVSTITISTKWYIGNAVPEVSATPKTAYVSAVEMPPKKGNNEEKKINKNHAEHL